MRILSVSVALDIQHAKRMRRIAICVLSGSTNFFHIVSLTARFSKKVTEHTMCVLALSANCILNISHSNKN
jgi:hypothetical protein